MTLSIGQPASCAPDCGREQTVGQRFARQEQHDKPVPALSRCLFTPSEGVTVGGFYAFLHASEACHGGKSYGEPEHGRSVFGRRWRKRRAKAAESPASEWKENTQPDRLTMSSAGCSFLFVFENFSPPGPLWAYGVLLLVRGRGFLTFWFCFKPFPMQGISNSDPT